MPPGFTGCGSGGNAIGLYPDPCWGLVDIAPGLADADAPLSTDPGGPDAGSIPGIMRS